MNLYPINRTELSFRATKVGNYRVIVTSTKVVAIHAPSVPYHYKMGYDTNSLRLAKTRIESFRTLIPHDLRDAAYAIFDWRGREHSQL